MATPTSEQRYGPTAGSFTGWVWVTVAVAVAVGAPFTSLDASGFRVSAVAAAAGLLLWMLMLRPRVLLFPPDVLELRNVLSSWVVPLAAVTDVQVRAFTRVVTTDGAYDGVGVGRPLKDLRRRRSGRLHPAEVAARESGVPAAHTPGLEADLMVAQVLEAAARARTDGLGTGPVRRVWALPELGVLAVLLVVAIVLSVV